jgi:5'-3' exonuclease
MSNSINDEPESHRERVYYCNIEIEVVSDYKIEEVNEQLSNKERINKIKKLCSIEDEVLNYKLVIDVRDKLWIFRTSLRKENDFAVPAFLQELLLDVFDKQFIKLTRKSFVGWFEKIIVVSKECL